MNPTAETDKLQQSELERCQTELSQLRERLRLLEDGQTQDLTQVVGVKLSSANTKDVEGNPIISFYLYSDSITTSMEHVFPHIFLIYFCPSRYFRYRNER